MSITWKEPAKAEIDCELFVTRKAPYEGHSRNSAATPDDLRAACAAVGLVVDVGEGYACERDRAKAERDAAIAACEEARTASNTWQERALKAEVSRDTFRSMEKVARDSAATEKARAEKAEGERDDAEAEVEILKLGAGDAASRLKHAAHVCDDLRTKLAAAEARISALTAPADGEPTVYALKNSWDGDDRSGHEGVASFALDQWRAGYAAGYAASPLHQLTAPVEGEPSYEATCDAWDDFQPGTTVGFGMHQWRMGRAACAARHQPTEPRATEDELGGIAHDAANELAAVKWKDLMYPDLRAHYRRIGAAVAARVRAERPACLVERAVAGRLSVELMHDSAGYLAIVSPSIVGKTRSMGHIPASEVRATLEAMLTEVGA